MQSSDIGKLLRKHGYSTPKNSDEIKAFEKKFSDGYVTPKRWPDIADIISGNSTLIEKLCSGDNELGEDLRATASLKTLEKTCYELGKYPYTVNTNNYNFTWNYFLGPMDIYIDKAWIYYDKIHAEEVFGSRFYTSVYTEFLHGKCLQNMLCLHYLIYICINQAHL